MKNIILIVVFFIASFACNAQNEWTLDKCIEQAQQNNLQIRQFELDAQMSQTSYSQSKAELLPTVSASGDHSYRLGRAVDPYTNQFTETTVQSNNFSIDASMPLFRGGRNFYTIKKNRFLFKASIEEVARLKNDISLNVAAAYLQVLLDEEMLDANRRQIETTRLQVSLTQKLVDAGSLAENSLLDIRAQESAEELLVINTENKLAASYLLLAQMLELESAADLTISRPDLPQIDATEPLPDMQEVYAKSLSLPQIAAAEYRLESAETDVAIARSQISPEITLTASYGTGYSDARKLYETTVGDVQPIGFVGSTGDTVFAQTTNSTEIDYPFGKQLSDNASTRISLNISVPIFNNLRTYTSIRTSKLQKKDSEYSLKIAENTLYQDVQQAHSAARASIARYRGAKKALEARQLAFDNIKTQYEIGLITTIDYNMEKNRLSNAESDFLQAKYEYFFRINILNFYSGKPLSIK